MKKNSARRLMAATYAALAFSTLASCAPTRAGELVLPRGASMELLMSKPKLREAQGGGIVTVEVGVIPGPLPAFDVPPSAPTTVAWFSNAGEGGKKEKRYGFKPRSEAEYELVLSNDGSDRTKWTLNEVSRRTRERLAHSTGHLWLCDPNDHAVDGRRDADFKDCNAPVLYDSAQITAAVPGVMRFASLTGVGARVAPPLNAAIWISCTSGCCSLGR